MMDEKFLEYFKTIGMTEPILKRVAELYDYSKALLPADVFVDVRVDEYIRDDGSRAYETICFYGKMFSSGIQNFMTSNAINISGLEQNSIILALVEIRDYDLKKATDMSRLNIKLQFVENVQSNWKASKENCDHHMELFRKYVLPRIRH